MILNSARLLRLSEILIVVVALILGAYSVYSRNSTSMQYATVVSVLAIGAQTMLVFYDKHHTGLILDIILTVLTSTAAVAIRPRSQFRVGQALSAFLYLSFVISVILLVLDFMKYLEPDENDEEDNVPDYQSRNQFDEEKTVGSGCASQSGSTNKSEEYVWAKAKPAFNSPGL